MPGLVLLARSRVYGPFRIGRGRAHRHRRRCMVRGTCLRLGQPRRPLVVENVASHALWLLGGLVVLTIAATVAESESHVLADDNAQ